MSSDDFRPPTAYGMKAPALTSNTVPVIPPASSEHRKPTVLATSSGVTSRPIAVAAFTFAGDRIVAIDVIADPAKLLLVQTPATRSQRA